MSWDYRVITRQYSTDTTLYEIHETYYEKNKPKVITIDPQYGPSETLEDLEYDLKMMLKAVKEAKKNDKLILKYKKFVKDSNED